MSQQMLDKTHQTSKEVRVIIIEDYKLTRVGLRCALNEIENINVIAEAQNAEIGLELIKKEQPDVVLMDLGLPGINGLEATARVKSISPNTKVVVLTSHDREEEVVASLGSGASGYCLKDIDPITLSGVIKNVAKGACWIDSNVAHLALKFFPKPDNTEIMTQGHSGIEAKARLTERENEVLKLLVQGKSNTQIAQELIVSVHTAKAHVCSILQKLCVDDRVQAAVKAIKEGIVSV